jgi:hypothetical protein
LLEIIKQFPLKKSAAIKKEKKKKTINNFPLCSKKMENLMLF